MSESASAAGSAGSGAASGASGLVSSAPAAANVAGTYGTMANAALDTGSTASTVGPTVGNAMSNYGTVTQAPGWFDKTLDFLNRYQKGSDSNVLNAYKNVGMNAETAGYVGGKLKGMMGGGGTPQPAAPININSSYQQPDNDYLKRYMMRGRR